MTNKPKPAEQNSDSPAEATDEEKELLKEIFGISPMGMLGWSDVERCTPLLRAFVKKEVMRAVEARKPASPDGLSVEAARQINGLKTFKMAVDAERPSLDKLGWTESHTDKEISNYLKGYFSKNYGMKISEEAILPLVSFIDDCLQLEVDNNRQAVENAMGELETIAKGNEQEYDSREVALILQFLQRAKDARWPNAKKKV